jgi:hypothetical protein
MADHVKPRDARSVALGISTDARHTAWRTCGGVRWTNVRRTRHPGANVARQDRHETLFQVITAFEPDNAQDHHRSVAQLNDAGCAPHFIANSSLPGSLHGVNSPNSTKPVLPFLKRASPQCLKRFGRCFRRRPTRAGSRTGPAGI